jgi:hypothetical protein
MLITFGKLCGKSLVGFIYIYIVVFVFLRNKMVVDQEN